MAEITREQQKKEALERMRSMELAEEIIEAFDKDGTIYVSTDPNGSYFPATNEVLRTVQFVEQEFGAVVYLVVRWKTVFGMLDSHLFVGRYVEDWENDRIDIADGYALTYTKNWMDDDCSEMGGIAFEKHPGSGITRVG